MKGTPNVKTIPAAVLAIAATTAEARNPCAPTGKIEVGLALQFGETIVDSQPVAGVTVQLWRNTATGTWTLTADDRQGTVCVLSSGKAYRGQTINGFYFPAA